MLTHVRSRHQAGQRAEKDASIGVAIIVWLTTCPVAACLPSKRNRTPDRMPAEAARVRRHHEVQTKQEDVDKNRVRGDPLRKGSCLPVRSNGNHPNLFTAYTPDLPDHSDECTERMTRCITNPGRRAPRTSDRRSRASPPSRHLLVVPLDRRVLSGS